MPTIRTLAIFVVFVCSAPALFAQGGATGAISGTVLDQSGGFVAGARIAIISDATGETLRQLTSDSNGLFNATLLPVGSYTLQVSATGFATIKMPGIHVEITETTRVTAQLKVSNSTEVVEVQSQVTAVNTTDATTGELVGPTTITTLPLATRNFQQILTLSAGASSDLNNASQLGRGQVFIHVNGGREDNNNYLIDGISVADYSFGELTYTPLPNPDAVQEFRVSTSLYDATQGRNGGGNINATLKSGTNQFHGDAWEYFRNTVLDAKDFFLGRPVIKQNIFGGDFGGPVVDGSKYGFFYVNYQGTRQRSGASPGTFINTTIPYVPATARASAAAMATACRVPSVDPVAFAILSRKDPTNQFGGGAGGYLFPLPTDVSPSTPCLTPVPFKVTTPGKFTDNQFVTNWDREFHGGNDRVAFRFFWADSDTYQPFGADSFGIQTGGLAASNNLNFPLDIPLHNRVGSITETHLFSPTLVNEFRFGVNIISDKLNNIAPVTGADVGINLPTANGDPNMYRLSFGAFQFGPYPTQLQSALSDSFILLDTFSWTHGKHSFRFGGEWDRNTIRRNLPVADNGLVFFVTGTTSFGSDFQSFLGGAPFFGEAGGGVGNHDYRIPGYAWFAQDDFRVTKNLTLNLGLRNEFLGAPYDELCHIGNNDPSLANTTGNPFIYPTCVSKFNLAGLTGTKERSTLDNNFATVFEPRIGLAYDLFGHHTTSIRAGYGIYSVREDLGAVDNLSFSAPFFPIGVNFLPGANSLANLFQGFIPPLGVLSPAFVPQAAFFTGITPSCTLGNSNSSSGPDQCGANFTGNVNSFIELQVPSHWVSPTTQQWNLSIQRELGRGWFLEVGYVGTKGTKLRSTYDPDQATLATAANPITIQGTNCNGTTGAGAKCVITDSTVENVSARAPFLGIAPANFEAFAPNSDSHYHALNLTVGHRFANGLYWQSAYTFSKAIDDVSTASVAFDTRFNDQTNPLDSTGPSDFDRRHRFVTSAVYQLPFFAHDTGIKKRALGDWEVSGVLILQSGLPFTPIDSAGGSAYALSSPNLATPTWAPGYGCANASTPGGTESRLAHWVNPLAYTPDATIPLSNGEPGDATLYGNVQRNCVYGPPQKNLDFNLAKVFQITERQSLRFRAEFFNIFNHPSFANPAALDIESPASFAQINSVVGTPRLIQFSLKYSF